MVFQAGTADVRTGEQTSEEGTHPVLEPEAEIEIESENTYTHAAGTAKVKARS